MSDGESTTPAPRRRPSYGLPGPTSPAADPGSGASFGAPSPHAASPHASSPFAASPYAAHTGPGPYDSPYGGGPQTGPLPAHGAPAPAARRRRGLWPLIIGLVLLLVVGPAATIIGIVWSLGGLVSDTASGPTVLQGGSGTVEVSANEMVIVYVPQADAEGATCTAEGSQPGAVTSVPSTSSVTFGDGSQYEQVLGVAALEDTTVTISCTGTDAPAYLGPFSMTGMAAPLLIGPIIGFVAGLLGLVLTIIGIVMLVRSRPR